MLQSAYEESEGDILGAVVGDVGPVGHLEGGRKDQTACVKRTPGQVRQSVVTWTRVDGRWASLAYFEMKQTIHGR